MTLTQAFAPFADEIFASMRPSVRLTLSTDPATPFDSKVGGMPYLPKDHSYPTGTDGKPMAFLAQINFGQMPALPDFPTSGILQFFIANNDDCFGINFDDLTDRTGYKLIYHAHVLDDINALQADIDVDTDEYALPFPTGLSYRISFDEAMPQAVTAFDFKFDETVPNLAQFLNDKADQGNYNWELHSEYDTWTQAESHRVGGYPFFTQDDVRGWEHSEPLSDYVLLFQLASEYGDEGVELMWGDCGVGNFFIHPDDLANLRFDKAFFTFDCY